MIKLKLFYIIILVFFFSSNFDGATAQISVVPVICVKAGENGIISVKVDDTENKIARISVTPRGYPDYVFELNDNGELGDEYAKDEIWSMEINIPYDAPAGIYNLDCEFYDSDGNPVMTKSNDGKETKLTATILLKV